MRSTVSVVLLVPLALVLAGCAENPYMLQSQIQQQQQQQLALTQQNNELRSRTSTLDQDNQELETLLAQSRQQARMLEDQVAAMREQLGSTTTQLASLRDELGSTESRARLLEASAQRRAGATIRVNNSLRSSLDMVQIEGVEIRQDGDVIRIELPGNKLFAPGSGRLLPDASRYVEQVAGEVTRHYPNQIIGVEGHTDTDPILNSQWSNNHQLSVGRAMAVYDHLVTRTTLRAEQLFVVGHGPNHPVVSNATPAGKERNRRVELVVYPERIAQK